MEKKIDETIPGGFYQGVDGSYHDANGKPLPAPAPVSDVVETTPEPAGETETEPAAEPAGEEKPAKKGKK